MNAFINTEIVLLFEEKIFSIYPKAESRKYLEISEIPWLRGIAKEDEPEEGKLKTQIFDVTWKLCVHLSRTMIGVMVQFDTL